MLIAKDNVSDIWLSKEEMHAKSYKITKSDRHDLERQQRQDNRTEARNRIKREKEAANAAIYKLWESSLKEAEHSGHLNCSWKGFRVIHPKVYEMSSITVLRLVGNSLSDVPRSLGSKLQNLQVLSLSCNGMTFVPKTLGLLTRCGGAAALKSPLRPCPFRFEECIYPRVSTCPPS